MDCAVSSSTFNQYPAKTELPGSEMDDKLAPSSISTLDDNSDTTPSSVDDCEEFLADSFLRECVSCGSNYSSQHSFPDGESPIFFKFLSEDKQDTPKSSLKVCISIETPKKVKLDEIEAARKAHLTLVQQGFLLEDLKLTSKRFKKDSDISLLGSLFKKILAWSAPESASAESTSNTSEEEEETESDAFKEGEEGKESSKEERIIHLGLSRNSVTKREYFSRELRREAQQSLFGGRKNVSFLDKVEVLEIPLLKTMSRRVKGRMFYSRNEFVQMIANNLKELEIEARRKQKQRRKKTFLSRA